MRPPPAGPAPRAAAGAGREPPGAAGARRWGTLQDAVQMKAQTVCVCFA